MSLRFWNSKERIMAKEIIVDGSIEDLDLTINQFTSNGFGDTVASISFDSALGLILEGGGQVYKLKEFNLCSYKSLNLLLVAQMLKSLEFFYHQNGMFQFLKWERGINCGTYNFFCGHKFWKMKFTSKN